MNRIAKLTGRLALTALLSAAPLALSTASAQEALLSGTTSGLRWVIQQPGVRPAEAQAGAVRLSPPQGARVTGTRYVEDLRAAQVAFRVNRPLGETFAGLEEQLLAQDFTRVYRTVDPSSGEAVGQYRRGEDELELRLQLADRAANAYRLALDLQGAGTVTGADVARRGGVDPGLRTPGGLNSSEKAETLTPAATAAGQAADFASRPGQPDPVDIPERENVSREPLLAERGTVDRAGYWLLRPGAVTVDELPEQDDRIYLPLPPQSLLVDANREDEDVVVTVRSELEVDEIAAYYRAAFAAQGFESDDLQGGPRGRDWLFQSPPSDRRLIGFVRPPYFIEWRVQVERERANEYRIEFNFEGLRDGNDISGATPAREELRERAERVRRAVTDERRQARRAQAEENEVPLFRYRAGDGIDYEFWDFFGPGGEADDVQELTGDVQLGVPESASEVSDPEVWIDTVYVTFEATEGLRGVFDYYDSLLRRQGFRREEARVLRPDTTLYGVYQQGTSANYVGIQVEQVNVEGDGATYEVSFNFSPKGS